MFLLSSGRSTVISEFHSLKTKDVYKHENNDTADFQFFPQQLVYAELNKKDRVEILRIKDSQDKTLKIQRLKKLTDNDAVCIACSKNCQEEVALGMRNGKIKLYDHIRSETVHQFAADAVKTGVYHLDYNSSDEYLSAVFENGLINIFGIRTKVKMDTINIDGVSTMTRFHPIKRSLLSIASHKGNVTIYDINAKRKTFHHTDVHTSPCRDLCMTQSRPDTLISVGFDCRVNIFDIRRKLPVAKFTQYHPLSAGAISDCGNYFCIGNLKGELMTYDIRNIKETRTLETRKVHDGQVARIAFFSTDQEKHFTTNLSNQTENTSNDNNSIGAKCDLEHHKSLTNNDSADMHLKHRDSFTDFLDSHQQSNVVPERHSISCLTKRNSYDCWDALGHKGNTSMQHQTTRRSSFPANLTDSAVNSPCQSFEEAHKSAKVENKGETVAAVPTPPPPTTSTASASRDRGKLRQIQEEQPSKENISTDSDKENNHTDLEISKRLRQLSADRNSTPKLTNTQRSGEMNATPTLTCNGGVGANVDMAQWRTEINARFDKLESELKFEIETNKWQIYTQNFNLWSKLNENNEAVSDALGILLQTDPFVNEFCRLKQENEMLKKELRKFTKQ